MTYVVHCLRLFAVLQNSDMCEYKNMRECCSRIFKNRMRLQTRKAETNIDAVLSDRSFYRFWWSNNPGSTLHSSFCSFSCHWFCRDFRAFVLLLVHSKTEKHRTLARILNSFLSCSQIFEKILEILCLWLVTNAVLACTSRWSKRYRSSVVEVNAAACGVGNNHERGGCCLRRSHVDDEDSYTDFESKYFLSTHNFEQKSSTVLSGHPRTLCQNVK